MEANFRIEKRYEGQPSKNIKNYETGLSREDAVDFLDSIAKHWLRLGGSIIEKTEDCLIVEDSNGDIITFEIFEE